MEVIGLLWNEVIIRPMINSLVVLYAVLLNNFGLSILAFTIIIRLVTMPLTLRQLRQTRGMSTLQPKIRELQQKHGKDRQRISQETMRLYREHGISPLGCLGPMAIQFPILIGLFYALSQTLPTSPENLADLSQKLYSWLPIVNRVVPVDGSFLWMNLAVPDRTPILPVLVGGSTWVQQKMSMVQTTDPRQQSTNTMMLWMFPLMLAFFTFQFPSGLAVYWFGSNLIGVAIQYKITGWGGLRRGPRAEPVAAAQPSQPSKEIAGYGQLGVEREDDRRSYRTRPKGARRKARRGRGKRYQ